MPLKDEMKTIHQCSYVLSKRIEFGTAGTPPSVMLPRDPSSLLLQRIEIKNGSRLGSYE